MKLYLGVGVVFQVTDQVAAEVADLGLEFSDVVPEAVQLGHHDLVSVRPPVGLPAGHYPNDSEDQSAQWANGCQDGLDDRRVHLVLPLQPEHPLGLLPGQVLRLQLRP